LHYVGHSGIDRSSGALILHDETSGTHWISAAELAKALPISVRLLCLSTCISAKNYNVRGLSRFAHASTTLRLPTLVINRYGICESTAKAFWSTFYSALAAKLGDVAGAMFTAQDSVRAGQGDEWGSFSLVQRDGGARPFVLTDTFSPDRYANELQA